MAKTPKPIRYPGRSTAPRRASEVDVDPGRRQDYEMSSGMPGSGHDRAKDDKQQSTRPGRAESRLVAAVAERFRTAGGDRATARRLAALAVEIDTALADSGFGVDEPLGPEEGPSAAQHGAGGERDFFSTEEMSDLANEGPDAAQSLLEPLDADQQPEGMVIPNRGLHAPTADEVGPRPAANAPPLPGEEEFPIGTEVIPTRKASRRRASSPLGTPWDTFKRTLRTASRRGGAWGVGTWETGAEDLGRVVELHAQSRTADGAVLAGEGVTFALRREDPRRRIATIDVHDRLIGHETRTIRIAERDFSKFVTEWAKTAEAALKEHLN